MKFKLLLVLFIAFAVLGNAQNSDNKSFKVGIGFSAGIPTGDFSTYIPALSLDVLGEYAFSTELSATLSAGYLNFVGGEGTGQIPILIGGKYQLTDKVYGSLQVGVTILDQVSGFTFAPGIGYKISKSLDLMVKYHSTSVDDADISYVGIRIGYTF